MAIEACGGCGAPDLVIKLDLGRSPLADKFAASWAEARALPRWPLQLARCYRCSLVQLTEIVPDAQLWTDDYGFYSGASSVVVEQQADYARRVIADHPRLAGQLVVEIACNDGTMLRHFAAAGFPSLGIDPARGPAVKAIEAGLDVWIEPFTADAATRIVAQHGQAGLVVANNVIAHVADLSDFVAGLRILLGPLSVAVIEFQYLADLILGNQFDHLYHEHRRFFSLASLQAALGRHGLQVIAVKQTTPQGGSLRVTVMHRGAIAPSKSVETLRRDEDWLSRPGCLDGLQGRAGRIRERLRYLLRELNAGGAVVAGYGASAKSSTLLNWCDIGPDLISYMVDTTPTKHGRYTPGTGIPIVSPTADSRAPDVYLLTVWNYLPAVLRREAAFMTAGGRFLVPIPAPVLL